MCIYIDYFVYINIHILYSVNINEVIPTLLKPDYSKLNCIEIVYYCIRYTLYMSKSILQYKVLNIHDSII